MKKRILSYFVYVIAVAVTATMVLLTWLTYNMFEERVMDDLSVNARMLGSLIEADEHEQVLSLLRDDFRVTLVRASGEVIYDSIADPAEMGDHAGRPEIRAAMETGVGRDVRNSQTVDTSTFYYALRLENGDVLRVAEEASSIWSIYLRALPLILLMMALMIGLCLGLAGALTARLIAPIEKMTAHLDNVRGVARYPELEPFMSMIQKQHEEILRSAEMRVEFTANVSHELKTPLTSISGYAELIESGMAQGEQAERFAGEIRKSANRLLTLINDIIRLSQMDSSTQNVCFEPVDLAPVAENVVEQLRMGAEKMDVSLELDARSAVVSADRQMMEELIYNLCDNAIRYNVRGGTVRVSVHPVQGHVILCVQDTGIGISRENQAHVFERFYRVDKSRSKATGGTGLGLAIVKHIAARHHASIGMESEPGHGTTITVKFDRA